MPARPDDSARRNDASCQPANALTEKLAARGFHAPFIYDRNLFQALNDIYAEHPLVPRPRQLSAPGLFEQAEKRVTFLLRHFDIRADYSCLEIGCGRGETAMTIAERCQCAVTGVDPFAYAEWQERVSPRLDLRAIDLTKDNPFEAESFDFIYSLAVLEHVQKPLRMLEIMYDLLKGGGGVYLTANLYRGPMASHRYREVHFPWPHLLFADDVFLQFYEGREDVTDRLPAWVNKLTHLHYLEKARQLGFAIRRCTYSRKPFDYDFYETFAEKLGKYPEEDLQLDFINLMLQKPARA